MSPERAARTLANIGAAFLVLVLLLRILSLTDTYAQSKRKPPATPYDAVPYLGGYSFSPSGLEVGFRQGWLPSDNSSTPGKVDDFYLNLTSGLFSPGKLPPVDFSPFILRDNQLYLAVGEGETITSGSPLDVAVLPYSLALSPDRSIMAFIGTKQNRMTLFALAKSGELFTLAQAPFITSPSWAPDSQALTFAMHRTDEEGSEIQIYRIQRDGSDLRQVTVGNWLAATPRWSPDGRQIAYFWTSTDNAQGSDNTMNMDIGLVDATGMHQRLLSNDGGAKSNLNWIAGTRKLIYTIPSQDWKQVEELRVMDISAERPQPARLYPPVSVESIACPKFLPSGGSASMKITLLNSGLQPVSIPLVLRSGTQPVPLVRRVASPFGASGPFGSPTLSPSSQNNAAPAIPEVHRQTVVLNIGESQTFDWPVKPALGLVTYFSALVIPEGQFPVSEKHCAVRNTNFGLPNLSYLSSMIPLTVIGMLLVIPWLRQQRKRYFWALWGTIPVIVIALIAIETRFVPPL